jgi:outer membrane protein assembly factor BamA
LIYLRNSFAQNLKKYLLNKNIVGLSVFCAVIAFVSMSCNPTKYVGEDESLLSRSYVVLNKKDGIARSEIESYIRQKPNKRIFGARFHLGLYNLSNIEKDNRFHEWLREIGEEPVIYDEFSTDQSVKQIKSFMASKGYFDSEVSDTVRTESGESKVFYKVDLKEPYTIKNIDYDFQDSVIHELFNFDAVNSLIETGQPYDEVLLKNERTRFTRVVRDQGFYAFSEDNIFFRIDSTAGNREVSLVYEVRGAARLDSSNNIVQANHNQYLIRNIYVYPEFVLKNFLENGDNYSRGLDTVFYQGVYFIVPRDKKPEVKYDLILQTLYVRPDMPYSVTNTEQTESHLLALRLYRLVHIFFNEVSSPSENGNEPMELDCVIQLTLNNKQSYKIELEGTNTAGDLGGGLSLTYQNNNLFRGAEQFYLTLKGSYEVITQQEAMKNTQEYGVETSLKWPKFIMTYPSKKNIVQKFNPSTSFSGAYNFQNMPLYSRTMGNASFGYDWTKKPYSTYKLSPLQLNVINVLRIDSAFKSRIERSPYLASAYTDVVILGGAFSYVFTNQSVKRSNDYLFVRFNLETSGNLLATFGDKLGLKREGEKFNVFGQPFAQYVKADVDLRYNIRFDDVSSMAYRLFFGAGVPYGNSNAMPFEKQYFGGGANGIRAWQARTLGPGSYLSNESGFLNQTGDIKIEANAEYRYKLFWILEGALFLDAGNIWSIYSDESRQGSQFKLDKFYDDIAVGSGIGLRFDMNFVMIRTDMGVKLRDPAIVDGSKWIITSSRPYNFKNDVTFVIAIGYPF